VASARARRGAGTLTPCVISFTLSHLWAFGGAFVSMRALTLTLRAASLSLSLFRAACLRIRVCARARVGVRPARALGTRPACARWGAPTGFATASGAQKP